MRFFPYRPMSFASSRLLFGIMGLCELLRAAASLPLFQRNVRGHGEGEAREEKRGGQGDVEERSLAEGDRCEKFSQATCDDF